MEIREIQSKGEWEGFLEGCKDKTFLQSWNWGEFQKKIRGNTWRLGFFEQGEQVGAAQVIKVQARRGTFLLVPHGPVSAEATVGKPVVKRDILESLMEKLKELAKAEGAGFIRINPIWSRSPENISLFKNLGCRDAPLQMHPEASWKLDISPSAEELFKGMRKTTRYLIRKAKENQDVTITKSTDIQDIERFSMLHKKAALRQRFVPFSKEYLENEFLSFAKDDQVSLFWAKYKGDIAAGSFVVFWSGIGFYHHAISLPEYAKLSLPYLLQWEAIKQAKARGCSLYDFWGYVNPETQPNHPWAGPTLFKMGFGGNVHEYVQTQDLPLSLQYWPVVVFEYARKLKRHL